MDDLFEAIRNSDLDKVREITSKLPSEEIEFDSLTCDGKYTALMLACESSSLNVIKTLLEKCALLGYEIGYCDNTVLKSLARGKNSDIEILNILLEYFGEKGMPYEVQNDGNESADEVLPIDGEPSLTPIQLAEKHGKTAYLNKFKEYL